MICNNTLSSHQCLSGLLVCIIYLLYLLVMLYFVVLLNLVSSVVLKLHDCHACVYECNLSLCILKFLNPGCAICCS